MFLHGSGMVDKVFTGLYFHSEIKNIIFEVLQVASKQPFPSPAAFTNKSIRILNPLPHIPGHRVSGKFQPSMITRPVGITKL